MAGYSATPLAKKLGIKPHSRLLIIHSPAGFTIEELPDGVRAHQRPSSDAYDTILLFAASASAMEKGFVPAANRLTTTGGLWVCWLKKSSGIVTDLTDSRVRSHGLEAGLVDVKVCAIDDRWSGLRFVRRLADR